MLDASGYPTPTDPGEIERRLKALETALAVQASARSLTSSAIGGGGVRVFGGGSIRVEDEGSFFVQDGDLVLGGGIIDGPALADQISTEIQTASSASFSLSTSMVDAATVSLSPPVWATSTVVSCQAVVRLPTIGAARGSLTGMGATPSVVTSATETGGDADTTVSLSWGGVTTASTITASVQARVFYTELTTPKQADLQVTAIYFR